MAVEPQEAWGLVPVLKSFLALLLILASRWTLPVLRRALANRLKDFGRPPFPTSVRDTQVPNHALHTNGQVVGTEPPVEAKSDLVVVAGGSRLGGDGAPNFLQALSQEVCSPREEVEDFHSISFDPLGEVVHKMR
jgi:hypothetical protein